MPASVQDKARASSLASGAKQSLWIAFESIDASANGIWLTRWFMNGYRYCTCFPVFSSNCDEPYIRLDDPSASIVGQHKHVSIVTRRVDKNMCSSCPYALFGCWQATANGTGNKPELLQFAQPFLIPAAGDFEQSTFDTSPGRVSIAGVNNNDNAPSAGISCSIATDSLLREAAFANDLRATDERGLIRQLNAATSPAASMLRICRLYRQ
jgi:hypothetical protein